MSLLLVDTNLLIALIVGRTDPQLLASHKRIQDYDEVDYTRLEQSIRFYEGVVTTPHILAEASNLVRQIRNPARDRIQSTLRRFILDCVEYQVTSADGSAHEHFLALGLTDASILVACSDERVDEMEIDLLTDDEPLCNRALSLGLRAELYA